jgi:pyridoxamine 5'-phosphate oxidase
MSNQVFIEQIPYTIDELYHYCWDQLVQGSIASKHPFHCPSISTVNNGFPESRTVVLRKAYPEDQKLVFHTDFRSPKIGQILENKAVSWLFYHPILKFQLRIKSLAQIHHQDEIALKYWNESRTESKKCYFVQFPPSSSVDFPSNGMPTDFHINQLDQNGLRVGYENFAVVENTIHEIDWLQLQYNAHRRAKFSLLGNEILKTWLIP